MNKQKKYQLRPCHVLLLALMVCMLLGCARQEQKNHGKAYQIYYLHETGTKIVAKEYITQTQDTDALIEELLREMRIKPEKSGLVPVLGNDYDMVNYTLVEKSITLNMDERYRELDGVKAILVRAALVRTITQIQGIQVVTMTINGEALQDASGNVIGPMKADLFIDNGGEEISPIEQVTLAIYFASEDGKQLRKSNRMLEYNGNIPVEKLVVEQLINGPKEEEGHPTVNPETKIVNVTTKDGICYVNLDAGFLNQIYEVSPEVTIYSIANSLVELPNINKVQLSVAGETALLYREKMDLSVLYERNLDLVEP